MYTHAQSPPRCPGQSPAASGAERACWAPFSSARLRGHPRHPRPEPRCPSAPPGPRPLSRPQPRRLPTQIPAGPSALPAPQPRQLRPPTAAASRPSTPGQAAPHSPLHLHSRLAQVAAPSGVRPVRELRWTALGAGGCSLRHLWARP